MLEGFEWDSSYELGYGEMDETHREFVILVAEMLTCDSGDLSAALRRFAVAELVFAVGAPEV